MTRIKKIILWFLVLGPFIGLFSLVQLTSMGLFGDLPTFEQLENPKNNLATRELMSTLILLEEYQKNKINWLSMYIVLIEDLETRN